MEKNNLWLSYRKNCEENEKHIEEKYAAYREKLVTHPEYPTELTEFITSGRNLNYFADYFQAKLEYWKYLEIIRMRQKQFKIQLVETESMVIISDGGSYNNVADLIRSILNSSIKEYLESKDIECLEEILTRVKNYGSLNIKFNLNTNDDAIFIKIRTMLRQKLLSDDLTSDIKAIIRKIINDIQGLIKLEFAAIKCPEDHDDNSLKRSNSMIDEHASKKVKINRNIVFDSTEIEKEVNNNDDNEHICNEDSEI